MAFTMHDFLYHSPRFHFESGVMIGQFISFSIRHKLSPGTGQTVQRSGVGQTRLEYCTTVLAAIFIDAYCNLEPGFILQMRFAAKNIVDRGRKFH